MRIIPQISAQLQAFKAEIINYIEQANFDDLLQNTLTNQQQIFLGILYLELGSKSPLSNSEQKLLCALPFLSDDPSHKLKEALEKNGDKLAQTRLELLNEIKTIIDIEALSNTEKRSTGLLLYLAWEKGTEEQKTQIKTLCSDLSTVLQAGTTTKEKSLNILRSINQAFSSVQSSHTNESKRLLASILPKPATRIAEIDGRLLEEITYVQQAASIISQLAEAIMYKRMYKVSEILNLPLDMRNLVIDKSIEFFSTRKDEISTADKKTIIFLSIFDEREGKLESLFQTLKTNEEEKSFFTMLKASYETLIKEGMQKDKAHLIVSTIHAIYATSSRSENYTSSMAAATLIARQPFEEDYVNTDILTALVSGVMQLDSQIPKELLKQTIDELSEKYNSLMTRTLTDKGMNEIHADLVRKALNEMKEHGNISKSFAENYSELLLGNESKASTGQTVSAIRSVLRNSGVNSQTVGEISKQLTDLYPTAARSASSSPGRA